MERSNSPASRLLPVVRGDTIHVFDCENLSWLSPIPITLPPTDIFFSTDDDERSSIVSMFLSDGRVFLLRHFYGGRGYVIEQSGAVHTYPGVQHNHEGGAMVEYDGNIYVFGGECPWYNGSRFGERLSLADGSWEPTCDMTENRDHFSGVLWHDFIFLCGGWHASNSIDRYDPRTNTMQQLSKILPESASPTLAFVSGEKLIVMSLFKSAKYHYKQNTLVQVSSKAFKDQFRLFTIASNPVVVREKVFVNYSPDTTGVWYDYNTKMQLGCFRPEAS